MMEGQVIVAGPLQGYTDAAWREAHAAAMPGAVDAYFAPFARVEHGAPRARDLRDVARQGPPLVPQVIFRSVEEFEMLAGALAAQGHTRIDLNLGCPFPPNGCMQCRKCASPQKCASAWTMPRNGALPCRRSRGCPWSM